MRLAKIAKVSDIPEDLLDRAYEVMVLAAEMFLQAGGTLSLSDWVDECEPERVAWKAAGDRVRATNAFNFGVASHGPIEAASVFSDVDDGHLKNEMLLTQAMQLAENDVVRARVEKLSICAYLAALEEALTWAWYTPETYPNSGKGPPVPPDVARRTRPHFRKFFELCKKHGVTMWDSFYTMDHMSNYFKGNFGLKPNEPW